MDKSHDIISAKFAYIIPHNLRKIGLTHYLIRSGRDATCCVPTAAAIRLPDDYCAVGFDVENDVAVHDVQAG